MIPDSITSLAFSPDGRLVFAASNNKTIKLWDLLTGLCLRTFEGHEYGPKSIDVSRDGQLLVSADGSDMKVWEISSGNCLRTLAQEERANLVRFSPDGRFVLSAFSASLCLWELATGQIKLAFDPADGPIDSIDFSQTGASFLRRTARSTVLPN